MRIRRTSAALAGASALALTLASCGTAEVGGGGNGGDSGNGDTITIGVKYDQPGLGLLEGNKPVGFDVDVATYIAGELGSRLTRSSGRKPPPPTGRFLSRAPST